MEHLPQNLADKLARIASLQFRTGYNFKRDRIEEVQKNEEFYYGRKIKVPRGRFGVPLPVMSGFVDTLMSKIDDRPSIKYGYTDLADLKLANKVSLALEKDSSPTIGNWAMKDRWGKKLGIFSGRTIYKYFAESDPEYKSNWEVVDHEDFVCEPAGGGHLEKHLFCGQQNIFRTKDTLIRNGKKGFYDKDQVAKLIAATGDSEYKKSEDIWKKKSDRYKMLGLDLDSNTYIGQPIYRLIEWGMEYEGKRYYLLFDYITGIWVRSHELKQVFESDLWPWHSWATHEDPFVFWSKAPCDDVRPIADAMDTLFNQALDNRQKRNMVQRAYDSEMFPDPSELEWRPDGLVRATPTQAGKPIAQGIYNFQVPEITGTIELVAFMDGFMGRKTGITPETEGAPERKDQKVGIYFGQLKQVADRLGLYNKSYNQCWEELGLRYAWGAKEHLSESELMKMIGEEAIGWHKAKAKAPNLDLTISGGAAEIMANETKARKRADVMVMISRDQTLAQITNPFWRLKETLKIGSYEDTDIKAALSQEQMGDIELQAEASEAIQDIIKGEEPKLNRGANTIFIQKILDFAIDKDVKDDVFKRLIAYATAHVEIATKNATRRATAVLAGGGIAPKEPGRPGMRISEETMVEEPIPGSKGATTSESLKASNILRGRSPTPI